MINLRKNSRSERSGFGLAIFAMILLMAGVALITMFPTNPSRTLSETKQTRDKMAEITRALELYKKVHTKYPCPARSAGMRNDEEGFGVAVDCSGSSWPGIDNASGDPYVLIGTVPTKELNLPSSYALDGWGRRFTYVMPKGQGLGGDDTISTLNVNGSVIRDYLLLSYGPNGIGAINKFGVASEHSCAEGKSADERENCNKDIYFIVKSWQQEEGENVYDDLGITKSNCSIDSSDCLCADICFDASQSSTIISGSGSPVDGTIDVGEVRKWLSVKGDYTAFQSESGNRPSYNFEAYTNIDNNQLKHNAISFDGSDDFMPIAVSGTEDGGSPGYLCMNARGESQDCQMETDELTMMVVFMPASAVSVCGTDFCRSEESLLFGDYTAKDTAPTSVWSVGMMRGRGTTSDYNITSSVLDYPLDQPTSATSYPEALSSEPIIYTYRISDSAATSFRVNGLESLLANGSNHMDRAFKSKLSLSVPKFTNGINNIEPFKGSMMEVRFFRRHLSDPAAKRAECELAEKWGAYVDHCQRIAPISGSCPANAGGCTVWLDASDAGTIHSYDAYSREKAMNGDCDDDGLVEAGECDNRKIDVWADKSGNSHDGVSFARLRRPAYYSAVSGADAQMPALPGLVFNNGFTSMHDYRDSFMRTKYDLKSDKYTVFAVFSVGDSSAVSKQTVIGGAQKIDNYTPVFALNAESDNLSPFVSGIASPTPVELGRHGQTYVGSFVNDTSANDAAFYINGQLRKRYSGTVQNGDGFAPRILSLGRAAAMASGSQFTGVFHELVVYERKLSAVESKAVSCYLANKWQVAMPSCYPDSPYTTPQCPAGTSGCVLWLDAADASSIITEGSNVALWHDKSGAQTTYMGYSYNHDAFTADTAKRPLYNSGSGGYFGSNPYITFAPGKGMRSNAEICTDLLDGSTTAACRSGGLKSYSMFMVYRPASTNATFVKGNSFLAGGSLWVAASTFWDPSPTPGGMNTSAANLVSIIHDGSSNFTVKINELASTSPVAPDASVTPGQIDFNTQSTNADDINKTYSLPNYFVFGYEGAKDSYSVPTDSVTDWGDLGEVIVYSSALSGPDEASVRSYLKSKWGI